MSEVGQDPLVDYILSPKAVRDRAEKILNLCISGEGEYIVHLDKLSSVADYVVQVIKSKYPDLKIPYHSRFNHFLVGGKDRVKLLTDKLSSQSKEEIARAKIDLVVTSVLLDAGAGADWRFRDIDGHFYSRSEGLAVASYNMFMAGQFSSEVSSPLRADGPGLIHITENHIRDAFQVSVGNPLLGLKGRADLIHRLGKAIESNPEVYGGDKWTRPGFLVDHLLRSYPSKKMKASDLLVIVLRTLGGIWPGRIVMNDVNLGDTWRHPKIGEGADGFVPFHKLSQWLTYSMLEPLEEIGFEFENLDDLTGLAEYRNGGLMLDSGLIEPKFKLEEKTHHPDSKVVVEWRALTIALLDRLAVEVRKQLGLSDREFPLAKVLEGGTWWAGRKLAQEKRGGKTPLEIISDGTVF